jgi:hypothetical protein
MPAQKQTVIIGLKKQHAELHRKVLLRRHLLRRWATSGAAYVPFIGDGDIALELYADRFILGADIDPKRVATASSRVSGDIRIADCDSWPFPDSDKRVSVADFDAYSDPYTSFRSFWPRAHKADRLVVIFTDGLKQGIERSGHWRKPDGTYHDFDMTTKDWRPAFHFYLVKHVWPWFEDFIAPYHVTERMRYLRGLMTYWGAAIEL